MLSGIEQLYRDHHREVRRFVARLVGESSADDVVASVFELAFRKLPARHPHPVGWLFRAADNLCKVELRRRVRESRANRDATVLTAGHPGNDHGDAEILTALLDNLPRAHRDVLQLTYWDRLSAADVGVVLGCSEAAVWKRISRAKAALRAAWPASDEDDAWKGVVANAAVDDH